MVRLQRALAPDGSPHWIWVAGGSFLDLSEAGLGDDLAEAAGMLVDRSAWEGLLAQAPEAAASTWPILAPGRPGKVLCLGKNFAAHAREMGAEPPSELVWFAKLPDTLIGPGEAVVLPSWLESRVDPEAELVLLLGRDLQDASLEEAEQAIAAYTLGNDITARGQQGDDKQRGWPWLRSKNLATFGCYGPAWVPSWALGQLEGRTLRGRVNGAIRQEAALEDLLWTPTRALVELSRWTPLRAGDMIYLGTPAGVAPIHEGDQLCVEMDGLGKLENPVRRRK